MATEYRTSASNYTRTFEGNTEVFPCHCGTTHTDKWDWVFHQCDHRELLRVDEDSPDYLLCTVCARTFLMVLPDGN